MESELLLDQYVGRTPKDITITLLAVLYMGITFIWVSQTCRGITYMQVLHLCILIIADIKKKTRKKKSTSKAAEAADPQDNIICRSSVGHTGSHMLQSFYVHGHFSILTYNFCVKDEIVQYGVQEVCCCHKFEGIHYCILLSNMGDCQHNLTFSSLSNALRTRTGSYGLLMFTHEHTDQVIVDGSKADLSLLFCSQRQHQEIYKGYL